MKYLKYLGTGLLVAAGFMVLELAALGAMYYGKTPDLVFDIVLIFAAAGVVGWLIRRKES